MRSLVHSSWHCSQATYAEHIMSTDSLGALATVPQHFQLQNVQNCEAHYGNWFIHPCTHAATREEYIDLMWGSEV